MLKNNTLRGKRGRCLLRASTVLNDASVGDQKLAIQKFMESHGIAAVGGDEVLEGVSGSKTFNRRDLDRLLASARIKKDYDLLIVYDSSRLTRGGARHGFSIRRDFAKAGIFILSVMDPVPDGDFKDVMQSLIDTQNNLFSKKLSGLISRGVMSSILRGDIPVHGAVPIGIDRLYRRADGTPFMRVRHVGNGVRELQNEETGKLIARYGANGSVYRKQKSEKVQLVMGDPVVVNAIREAFELRYKYGWGYGRIGLHLTQLGIKPMKKTLWSSRPVRDFLVNPLYLGWSYFLKSASGLFTKMTVDGPVTRTDVDQDQLEEQQRMTVPHAPRSVDEMFRIEHPGLKDFLIDPVVRQKAEAAIKKIFDEYHLPKKPAPLGICNRYPRTRYFLRGLMLERTYQRHLVGRVTSGTHENRYYHLSHNTVFCKRGEVGRRTIPAEPLERAVLEILRHLFGGLGQARCMVDKYVTKVLAERPEQLDRQRLELELKEVKSRMRLIYTTASMDQTADLLDILKALRAREEEIGRQLTLVPLQVVAEEAGAMTEKIHGALCSLDAGMDERCYERLRHLLRNILRNFTVDLGTREASFEVVLPEDLLRSSEGFEVMCATSSNFHSSSGCTLNSRMIEIGVFKLIPPIMPSLRAPTNGQYRWIEITDDPNSPPAGEVLPNAA